MTIIAFTGLGAALAMLAGAAAAPQQPTSASTEPLLGGPVISGVCVLSPETVLGVSKAGQATNLRLQQLAKDVQDEIQGERIPLETEARTIETESKSLGATELQKRRAALADKLKLLQDRITKRNRELEYTKIKVVQQISQQAQPIIAAAYKAHNCGILFRKEEVLGGNPTNDLTPEIIHGLDAKLTTMNFNRESLPTTPAQSTAPAA